ncbi:MAG: type II/IV secretion system protein [Planctomycetia bacterium]|nr:type II/IV secretion system protein [Planctomycetia bacterium]
MTGIPVGEHFYIWGAVWLVAAAAWAAACVWVDRDAEEIFGRTYPWAPLLVALGTLFLLGSLRFGLSTVYLMLPALVAVVAAYTCHRDLNCGSAGRILPSQCDGLLQVVGQAFGRNASKGPTAPRGAAGGPQVVLLKKDGRPYDGRDAGSLDRETSEAIMSAQSILARAVGLRATDIHLEPKGEDELLVRYRIDGMMQNAGTISGAAGRATVSAIKVLGDMDIAERRRPQDGTFAVLYDGRKFDIRAASGPTNFGEKIALRLLDAGGGIVKQGLEKFGMRDVVLKQLRDIIHRPHGMLIVCGPTGSGKTTTLYGALGEIDVLSRNIVTIEDPIEYRLENISQTAVNVAADLTFAKILRSVLRQDPDVILVGEIRDKETAEIAMQAALTGHFVFTTLHANDTATTVTRLLDIGIDTSLIQSAVTAVLAQRLIRVLCGECKQPYKPTPEFLKSAGIPADKVNVFYKEKGCPACNGTGYRGRTGVHELMVVDKAIRELIVGQPSIQAIRTAARKAGMRTLQESGLQKVIAGITSVNEVVRVTKA